MTEAPTPNAAAPKLELLPSRQFPAWLAEQNLSLAFTTYQTGKLFLVGLQPNGRLSIFERSFNRAMGLWASPETLYLSTLFQLWRFDNALEPGQAYQGYDRLYVPQVAWTTGDLDIHDVAEDAKGRIVFVNTLFGCLADAERGRELRAALAAAVHQPPRGRGPLPSERPGAQGRTRRLRDRGQPLGRGGRLARPADRGRRAGRRGGERGGAGGPLDAAFAALARRRRRRAALAARFRHRLVRPCRPRGAGGSSG